MNQYIYVVNYLSAIHIKGETFMTFEDNRKLGIQQGCIVITDQSKYLVVKKNENYSLLSIATAECINFEVSLEHLEEITQVDLKEKIRDIIPPENIKIVAQNRI
jgi:hypothetical protein